MVRAQPTTIEGEYRGTRISVADFPYMVCPSCESKAFVHVEFPATMLDPIDDALPFAEGGERRGQYICFNCRQPFVDPRPYPVTVALTSVPEGFAPLPVTIRADGFQCNICGTAQLAGKAGPIMSDIADALIVAFRSVGPINRW